MQWVLVSLHIRRMQRRQGHARLRRRPGIYVVDREGRERMESVDHMVSTFKIRAHLQPHASRFCFCPPHVPIHERHCWSLRAAGQSLGRQMVLGRTAVEKSFVRASANPAININPRKLEEEHDLYNASGEQRRLLRKTGCPLCPVKLPTRRRTNIAKKAHINYARNMGFSPANNEPIRTQMMLLLQLK